jgi:glycogen operon protein
MISHGDEIGRTQRGNNNAYCQDNELTWTDWNLDARSRELLEFARRVFALRVSNPVLRRRSFFRGHPIAPSGVKDLSWLRADGQELSEADWRNPRAHALAMLIHGRATDETDERGRLAVGETVLLMLNGGNRSRRFALPKLAEPGTWIEVLNTVRPGSRSIRTEAVNLVAHSLILFRYELLP